MLPAVLFVWLQGSMADFLHRMYALSPSLDDPGRITPRLPKWTMICDGILY